VFDACVLYEISENDKKRLQITIGSARIKKDLEFNPKSLVFLQPSNPKILRESVDKGLPYGIINSELIHAKDSVHYPRAGIDDTIAKIMARKKIAVVFNLNLLIKHEGENRGRIIRRMKENMRRAVKYDAPVLFASCAKNKYELFNSAQIQTWAKHLGIDNFNRVKTSFEKVFK
jgi:RNase P/RNase MRP subunit p30